MAEYCEPSGATGSQQFVATVIAPATGYTNVRSGALEYCEPCATITIACPTGSVNAGTPYDSFAVASGGVAPYTYAITAGALPDGLTLNTSTGEITGTPTVPNTFNFTITATDASRCTGSNPCSIIVNPTSVTACGYPLAFDWRLNTLVGPFWTSANANQFFVVGCESTALKKLLVYYSSDYGATWSVINNTFPTLVNQIRSYEIRNDDNSSVILMATQEDPTGRVAYSEFNMATQTWTQQNVQVVASASLVGNDHFKVSVAKRTNGDRVVNFTDKENVAGTDYKRSAFCRSTDGGSTWGSEIILGSGIATHLEMGYCMAGTSSRIHFFYADFGGNPNVYIQTLKSDSTLGSANDFLPATGANGISGRPALDSTNQLLYVPFRNPNPYLATITDVDVPVLSSFAAISSTIEITAGGVTGRAAMDLDFVGGDLYMTAQLSDGGNPTWFFVQHRISGVWTPSTTALRVGPVFPQFALTSQIGEGRIVTILGTVHSAVVLNMQTGPSLNGFQLAPVSGLPTDNLNVAQWVTACTH